MLPKGKDRIETLFVCGGMILGRLTFGSFDKSGKIVNDPAAKRIRRITQLKLADQFLAERQNRVRWFGCGRRL